MTINMDDSHLVSVTQIKEFLKITALVNFKGIVRNYIIQMTGFSPAQASRLIKQKKKTGKILVREFEKFKKKEYERLSKISIAHIYNLRGKRQYTSASLTYTKTQFSHSDNGKRRKIYDICMVPYEKLKSLEDVASCLRHGITFEILDAIAYEKSDNEYAALMQEKKKEVFNNLKK